MGERGPFYVREKAAEILGVTLSQFIALVKAGELPRRGSNLRGGRYEHSEVMALRDARSTAARQPVEEKAERIVAAQVHTSDGVSVPTTRPCKDPIAARRAPKHLYLVEIVGHSVKVGITGNPLNRIASHVSDARKFGFQVGRIWVSFKHAEARINEVLMKCGDRSEYLRRRFERLVARAHRLPMTRAEV